MITLGQWRELRREVLGLNRRNLDLLQRYNRAALYPVVDHKERTKAALTACGLPVPATYAVLSRQADLSVLGEQADRWNEFVLKPARGSGGEGVVVIAGRERDAFVGASGRIIRRSELLAHAADILAGAYAISGSHDEALLEYRLRSAPEMAAVAPGGVADVRVLVFRGVPVMAMLRLPTKASHGRANLHAGGIGVGIDLLDGRTGHAICQGRPLGIHPDTGAPLSGWKVPAWDTVLLLATQAFDAVPLGYVGVDIVLDAARGPVILELNARPGLAIQLATERGLRPVLDRVAALAQIEERPAAERVAVGKDVARAA